MPWTQPPAEDPPVAREPDRQPMFNAPLVAILLALSMPALFFFQLRLPGQGFPYAFAPADLMEGRFGGLFMTMLMHGSWAHVAMNALGALAFGAPVARLFRGAGGVAVFLAFYMACGALAALGYGLIHWGATTGMVGASGAVFGLIGASTRLLGPHGWVLPLTHPRVASSSLAWMGLNLVVGLIGLAPGAGGARIAWEAHAIGFVVGILAIGPLARAFRAPAVPFDSSGGMGDPHA